MAENKKIEELYPRAPRYMIEIDDNQVVRFALMPRGSKAMYTRIINLSESGMAFLIPYLSAPTMNEKIKLEFTAPFSEPIACFAKVVRVQVHKTFNHDQKPQTFKLIAVNFENLHPKQRQILASGLNQKFKKRQADYKREQMILKLKWYFSRGIKKLIKLKKPQALEKLFQNKKS